MTDDRITRKDLTEMEERISNRMREMEERLFKHIVDHVDERVEQTETKLLSAFHGWARSMEIRVRGVAGVAMGFDERLALAEERISELERRKGKA